MRELTRDSASTSASLRDRALATTRTILELGLADVAGGLPLAEMNIRSLVAVFSALLTGHAADAAFSARAVQSLTGAAALICGAAAEEATGAGAALRGAAAPLYAVEAPAFGIRCAAQDARAAAENSLATGRTTRLLLGTARALRHAPFLCPSPCVPQPPGRLPKRLGAVTVSYKCH